MIRPSYRDNPYAWHVTPRYMTDRAKYGYAGSKYKRRVTPMSIVFFIVAVLLMIATILMALS